MEHSELEKELVDFERRVLDGKYTFKINKDGWSIDILRYDEPWLNLQAGHKAILALMMEGQGDD